MKINFNQQMMNIDGKTPIKLNNNHLSLRDVAIDSLLRVDNSPGEVKVKRFEIARRINEGNGVIEFSLEELVIIKNLIGIHYSPLVVAQAWAMLEGKNDDQT